MGASPTFVPVIRTGVDVEFADVQVVGDLSVTGVTTLGGNVTVTGYAAFGAGQFDGQLTLWTGTPAALRLGTAGGGLAIAEGANARQGGGTLVAGTVAVANTSVTANTRVQVTRTTAGAGALGHLSIVKTPGVGFTVTSSAVTDISSFDYLLTEIAAP